MTALVAGGIHAAIGPAGAVLRMCRSGKDDGGGDKHRANCVLDCVHVDLLEERLLVGFHGLRCNKRAGVVSLPTPVPMEH